MNQVLRTTLVTLGSFGLLLSPMVAKASNISGVASVPLSYNSPEMLSLSATVSTGSTVAFPIGGGTAPGTIMVHSHYSLNPGRVVTIEAGFASFDALSDNTGDYIAPYAISAVFSSINGTVSSRPNCSSFGSNRTSINFGLSCGYITYPPTENSTVVDNDDTISLTLDPSTIVPPGTYTGTLLIAAQAN